MGGVCGETITVALIQALLAVSRFVKRYRTYGGCFLESRVVVIVLYFLASTFNLQDTLTKFLATLKMA